METIQEFVDRTKGPLVPYVHSWYPWVYAHHYLRTEMDKLPVDLGKIGPRMSLDEAVELVQVWSGLTGESIEVSARALADAYLLRWGVPRNQIGRPPVPRAAQQQVPTQPSADPAIRNQAPVSPVAGGHMGNQGKRPNRTRSVKQRGVDRSDPETTIMPVMTDEPEPEDVAARRLVG